jgi:hypothetical protein
MGMVELYLIYEEKGVWEPPWLVLQGMGVVEGVSSLPRAEMEQALIGWTRPLVDTLGPPPQGMLLKLPPSTRLCATREHCPFHQPKACGHSLPKMPWCFVPDGVEDDVRPLLAELIKLWREGVYVLVVQEG